MDFPKHLNHREMDLAIEGNLTGEPLKHLTDCKACRDILAHNEKVMAALDDDEDDLECGLCGGEHLDDDCEEEDDPCPNCNEDHHESDCPDSHCDKCKEHLDNCDCEIGPWNNK